MTNQGTSPTCLEENSSGNPNRKLSGETHSAACVFHHWDCGEAVVSMVDIFYCALPWISVCIFAIFVFAIFYVVNGTYFYAC